MYEPFDTFVARGQEQTERARRDRAVRGQRIAYRTRNGWDRREMENAANAAHDRPQVGRGEIGADELDRLGDIREPIGIAGAEVVHYADATSLLDEAMRQMGSDEPGTAGDEVDRHGRPAEER